MTQGQLAEALGVDLRYVQTLEGGKPNPTATTVLRLADALEIDPGELFAPVKFTRRRPGRPAR